MKHVRAVLALIPISSYFTVSRIARLLNSTSNDLTFWIQERVHYGYN
jgi:hypothetical protein